MSHTTWQSPYDIARDKERKVAKAALMQKTDDDIHPTKAEMTSVFEDCYVDIANRKVDGPYIMAVIDGIGWRVSACGNKPEDVKEGVEQLLALAARTIKGEGCASCGDKTYCSGSGVSPTIHEDFVECIFEMVSSCQIPPINHRAKFSLDRLCAVFGIYHQLRDQLTYLAADNWGGQEEAQEQLEGIWCHRPYDYSREERVSGCRCWDAEWYSYSSSHYHSKGCWGYCL
jgi:hypothetical protein